MTTDLTRAHLLLEQGRFSLAAEELGRHLASSPDDAGAHCLLALCLSQMKQHQEAVREARTATALAPDFAYAHYILGGVLKDVPRLKEAESAAHEALRLDPEDADTYALLAGIHVQQSRWAEALRFAEQGLACDPENLTCANFQGIALTQLGRRGEAVSAIRGALARDPENAAAHANQGWAALHSGDHRAALVHFRESLRRSPDMEWARQGLLEALRARNPLYRLMLRYFLWSSRLSRQGRWIFVIGFWFVPRVLNSIVPPQSPIKPFTAVAVALYIAFAFLTWTAKPLVNLTLRWDPYGRYALTPRQILASNWVGSTFALAVLGLLVWLPTRSETAMIAAIGYAFLTAILAATFSGSTVGVRRLTGTLSALTGLLISGFIITEVFSAAPALGFSLTALLLTLLAANITAQLQSGQQA